MLNPHVLIVSSKLMVLNGMAISVLHPQTCRLLFAVHAPSHSGLTEVLLLIVASPRAPFVLTEN